MNIGVIKRIGSLDFTYSFRGIKAFHISKLFKFNLFFVYLLTLMLFFFLHLKLKHMYHCPSRVTDFT